MKSDLSKGFSGNVISYAIIMAIEIWPILTEQKVLMLSF
ncbi:protein of unknown function [Ruminococcaceae bacterium BL-4]|nr:protein of unknown function [Ruminococcaceae bacterium BL-4]